MAYLLNSFFEKFVSYFIVVAFNPYFAFSYDEDEGENQYGDNDFFGGDGFEEDLDDNDNDFFGGDGFEEDLDDNDSDYN